MPVDDSHDDARPGAVVRAHLQRALPEALVLAQRRVHSTEASELDVVAVVSSGVWVVDAREYRPAADAPPADRLKRRIDAVESALVDVGGGPVRGSLVVVGADRVWRQRVMMGGVEVLTLRGLTQQLKASGPLGEDRRSTLHRHLADCFPVR